MHEDHSDARQVIDDRTLNDLDFEELFMSLDRTSSAIGQQYLYSKLRVIPKDTGKAEIYDQLIDSINERQKEKAIIALRSLYGQGAYFLQRLFFGGQITKPKWFWIIPLLSISSILTLLVSLLYQKAIIIALILICVNTIIHLWNKNNVLSYSNIIPQLLSLHRVAKNLHESHLFLSSKENVGQAIGNLNKIRRYAFFFKWESTSLDDLSLVFEYLLDLLKGIFLLEPIVFFKLLKEIESNQSDIKTVYDAIGQLDMAISISTWRESLPHYCKPDYSTTPIKVWDSERLYHPLVTNPVTNDLTTANGKSILLSGSNMSGKTTFIRAIGINAILSQTINTACAQHLELSPYNIHSAIRISDDVLDDTSYYYEEVKTVKKLANESQQDHYNLFLLDEIFKGTNTIERVASGKAVLSFLETSSNLVFCSTHDLELIGYLQEEYQFFHFEEHIEDGELRFDYKLKEGSLNNTNAIRILEMNDFPSAITDEAKEIARELFKKKEMKN